MSMLFRLAAVAAVVCIGTTLAVGGDGKKPNEIKGWGTATDPDGDCTFKEDKGKLTITVPAGFHDLHPARAMNAARVLREIEGDFTATVKVSFPLTPGKQFIRGRTAGYFAGLLLWTSDKEYIRLERNAWRPVGTDRMDSYVPLFEHWKDGDLMPTKVIGELPSFGKDYTWLKLERKAGKVTGHLSHDGKEWVVAREANTELPKKLHIGVAAINTSDIPFAVGFKELKVEATK
jgi:hypothetical protein